jgi:hypothetical protein
LYEFVIFHNKKPITRTRKEPSTIFQTTDVVESMKH